MFFSKSGSDLPNTMVDLYNTMVDLPNTMVELPNTMLDLHKTLVDFPNTMVGGRRTMRSTPGREPVCTVLVTPGPGKEADTRVD